MLPDGVLFESLSFLYPPVTHFFDLKFLMENRPFFRPRFFILTDGWDGWMDGWIGLDGILLRSLVQLEHLAVLKTSTIPSASTMSLQLFENVRTNLKNIHVFGEYCNNKKTKQIFVPEFDKGQIAHTCVGDESFLFRTV